MNPTIVKIYTKVAFIRAIYLLIIDIISIFILVPLYLVKPFKHVKLFRMVDWRIGHLAANTELFLRRIQLGTIKTKGITFVGIASTKPANQQLLKMFKRKLRIIQIPQPGIIKTILMSMFSEKSLFGKSPFFQPIPFTANQYPEFNHAKHSLSFTAEEEEKGKTLLRKMGIPEDAWVVCFNARDSSYLAKRFSLGASEYSFRDSDINTFLKAAEYITSKGGFVLRMGHIVSKKLSSFKNTRIIDYASKYRTDFGDIYLPAKCKFFLGDTGGLPLVSSIFNVPRVYVNFIPLIFMPLRKGDLTIPKKIWSKKEKRFLTFSEMFDREYNDTKEYETAGLFPVENHPTEILDVAKEMCAYLDGSLKYNKEDEKLQKKFHSLIKKNHPGYGTPSRIGSMFLRKNKELLKKVPVSKT